MTKFTWILQSITRKVSELSSMHEDSLCSGEIFSPSLLSDLKGWIRISHQSTLATSASPEVCSEKDSSPGKKNKNHCLLRSLSVLSALCLRPLHINSNIVVFNRRTFLLSKIQLRLFWSYFPTVLLRMPLSYTKLWLCQHSTVFLLSDVQLWLSTTGLPLRDTQSPKNNLPCLSVMCSHRYLIAIPSHDCLRKLCHISPQQHTDMTIPKSHDQLWMHCHVSPLSSICSAYLNVLHHVYLGDTQPHPLHMKLIWPHTSFSVANSD